MLVPLKFFLLTSKWQRCWSNYAWIRLAMLSLEIVLSCSKMFNRRKRSRRTRLLQVISGKHLHFKFSCLNLISIISNFLPFFKASFVIWQLPIDTKVDERIEAKSLLEKIHETCGWKVNMNVNFTNENKFKLWRFLASKSKMTKKYSRPTWWF